MDLHRLTITDPSLKGPKDGNAAVFLPGDPNYVEQDSLIFIKNERLLRTLANNRGGHKIHLVVTEEFYQKFHEDIHSMTDSVFTTQNFDLSMSRVSKGFYDEIFKGINHYADGRQMGTASVDPSTTMAQQTFLGQRVTVGKNCIIHPQTTIMAATKIGNNVEIFPNVTIYPNATIGNNVRIHAGTVIGSDGFGYRFIDGTHHKLWHTGSVIIEEGVEIGAGTCIDGGTFSPTLIGAGTKIDNQVHIGHNCRVGKGVVICGQVGISGSVTIGDFCLFGGKAGVSQGIHIGHGCQIAGASAVTTDWPEGSVIGGNPARPLKEWLRALAYLRNKSARN